MQESDLTPMLRVHGGKRGSHGGGVIDFSSNVCDLGPPASVLEAIRNASGDDLSSYPDPGYPVLRAAISGYSGRPPEEILPVNGSVEAFYLACQALRPRRTFIISPSFCEYGLAAQSVGAVVEEHVLREEDGFALDPVAAGRLARGADLVFLCNPASPTGRLHPLAAVLEFAAHVKPPSVLLVDEAFIDFCALPGEVSAARRVGESMWVSRSLTKFFALAGLRVGYLLCPRDAVERLESISPPWRVNSLAESAAVTALSDTGYIERIPAVLARERESFARRLEETGLLKVYPAVANFLLARIKRPGLTSGELAGRLLDRGFLVRDASSFSGLDERYIRLAVRSEADNAALANALEEVGRQ